MAAGHQTNHVRHVLALKRISTEPNMFYAGLGWVRVLTSLTSAASRSPCIWDAFDALRREIDRICADLFFDDSDARHFARSFQHSIETSGGLGALLSIKRPSRNRRLMRTFVTIFWNHISSIFFPLPFPLISHSVVATNNMSTILQVNLDVVLDVTPSNMGMARRRRGHTCVYSLEEAILGMLGLAFPAVAGVKVLRQELDFLLQHLLHRAVGNAFGVHHHGLPHVLGLTVCLRAALPWPCIILGIERIQVFFVIVGIRFAGVCLIGTAAPTQTTYKQSGMN